MNDIIQEEDVVKCARWFYRSRETKAKNWPLDRATWGSKGVDGLPLGRGVRKPVGQVGAGNNKQKGMEIPA